MNRGLKENILFNYYSVFILLKVFPYSKNF